MVTSTHRSGFRQASLARLATTVAFTCVFTCVPLMLHCGPSVLAQDTPVTTQQLQDLLRQKQTDRQSAARQVALQQAALEITQKRMAELQKLLDDAAARAATEQATLTQHQQTIQSVDAELTALTESLKKHQAADALQTEAVAAQGRLDNLIDARSSLESQLAELRKSAVEWQSKTTEAQQQIQTLEGQRAEFQKAVEAAQAPDQAAQQQLAAANETLKTATEQVAAFTTTLAAEQKRLESATVSSQKLAESIAALQKSLEGLQEAAKVMGVNPEEAVTGLSAAIKELQPLQQNAQKLVTQATERRDAMMKQLAAATTDQQNKQTAQTAAADAAVKAAEGLKLANDKIVALNQQQQSLQASSDDAAARHKMVTAQIAGLEPSVAKLTAEIQMVTADTVAQQKLAQEALQPLGRFVSFSQHVAPILAKRCIACHNTRSPGGRLNLDSWAALSRGGESGSSFETHNSGDSLLVMMIEDGSMPKDADPLTPDEISVIKQWIDVGAPLDAGVLASAELFDVMPEVPQPLPPESYRVPIPITATAFHPDGSLLATSGYHEVLIWNTADGALAKRISNVAERVYDIEFSPDGQQLAVAAGTPGQLGEVKLFNTSDGQLQDTLVRAKDAIFSVSFSPDGTQLASGGADRTIRVTRVADGVAITSIEDHADWVMDVNWSPDASRLVSSSRDKTCKVFNAVNGDPQITFSGHGEAVYSAAFLADSKTVVSGGADKRVRIWNTADAKEIRAITGFGSEVFHVLVTAGDHVLTACADRNVREHNAADGKLVRTLSGHADWVYTLSTNATKKLIASGSYDGEVRLWNAEDGSMTTSFIAVPKADTSAAVATSK